MITSPTRLKILRLHLSSGVSVRVKKLHHSVSQCDLPYRDLDGAVKVLDEMPDRTPPSLNKIINGYLANNSDEATFSALLKSCVDLHSVEKIHARIVRHGFDESPLLSNLMIDRYLRNRSVDSGRKVFVNLRSRDSVSVVAMISGLSRNGREEEAVSIFAQIHASGIIISATPYVFSSVLSACTKVELNRAGLQIHGLALRLGFSSETYVCNALVTLYSRSGDLNSAEKIFVAMENRDGISYNTLISGLSQRGFSRRALGLFEGMRSDLLKPDCVTVASLLSACAAIGSLIGGEQLHSYAMKLGMTRDIVLEGSLLDLYVKCSDSKTACEFFLTTERRNTVLWNVMLVSYGQSDDLIESVRIFKQMLIEGVIPNDFTYPSILRTCTSVGEVDLGEQIHTQTIKSGFQRNVYVSSVLIDMYAKHGKLEAAMSILRRLKEADVVAWTAMIAGLAKHDLFSEALELFREMEILGIRADNIGFASAITACAGIKALKLGKQIHAQSYVSGNSDDISIGNALVSLYSRSGRVSEAYTSFHKTDNKNIVAWNSLISGFAQSGLCDEALRVYFDMNSIEIGAAANSFTFGSAISAAANSVNVKQGQRIHATALKSGHASETEASNALITLYAKCGRIDDAKREFYGTAAERNEVTWNAVITACSQHGCGLEATKLFEEMKRLGFEPSHVTFVAVLTACSHVGLINDGLRYFESMGRDHNLRPKPEHYVCVVDMYGRAGLIGDAKRFIEKMPIKPDAMIWRTLLSACTVHGDVDIGEYASENLVRLEPDDSATYVLSSNMYAVAGNWGFQDQTRKLMKQSGVKKEIARSWGRS